MARKLYYFDTKGLGESIRYLLHYGGLEFEDIRFTKEEYPKIKEQVDPPFGKVPLYVEGDRKLHQSLAIAKYIGRKVGLAPTDPWEEAQIEAVLHTYQDLSPEMKAIFGHEDEVKKEELKKKFLEGTADDYYKKFDKQLADNNGHFSTKLSWVDIAFVAMTEILQDYFQFQCSKYPNVNKLVNEVHNLKGIKEYIAKRKN